MHQKSFTPVSRKVRDAAMDDISANLERSKELAVRELSRDDIAIMYDVGTRLCQMERKFGKRFMALSGVGMQYLEQLIQNQQFERAAEMCPTVFGADARFWEELVYRFACLRQLRSLAHVLPQGGLDPTAYEMVLNEFLQLDPEASFFLHGFLQLITVWDPALYSVPTVVNAVRDRLSYEPSSVPLLKGLAHLYSVEGKFDLAIAIYLEIGAADAVFSLVQKHGLYGVVQEKLALLIRLDEEKANELLVKSTDQLPPDTVAERLRQQPQALFRVSKGGYSGFITSMTKKVVFVKRMFRRYK
ncbi:hypothetical protein HPB51_008945 [Rhipicephalus microplus]|uniref:Uncharacterized protein n=1 Tax=Rhipicephalus microplus TaxID=6941 RepID=A0A9J6D5A1_RHIMP|nr:hypothetical protein HPB51_008945 [Rhipicephalus microplus]